MLGLSQRALINKLNQIQPDFVGITATTLTIEKASKIANIIKSFNNRITVLIGGHHVTALPLDTMRRYKGFDIGVIGEGEITVFEIIKNYPEGKSLRDINGIAFREAGDIHLTSEREFISELDSLPFPAWDLLGAFNNKHRYRPSLISLNKLPSLSVMFSRGCLGKCRFCANIVFKRSYRTHSPNYFIEILKYLKQHGIKDLSFQDSAFAWDSDKTINLCNLMIKNNLKFTWNCQTRADILNKEKLKIMSRAGCWQVKLGLESADPHIQEKISKNINLEKAEQVINICRKYRMKVTGYFIFGSPGETKETMRSTVELAKRIRLDDFKVNYMTPYPGSMLYGNAEKFGKFDNKWTKMNERTIVFVPYSLTKEEMAKMFVKSYIDFYLRPIIIMRHYRWLIRLDNIYFLLIGLIKFVITLATKRTFLGRTK